MNDREKLIGSVIDLIDAARPVEAQWLVFASRVLPDDVGQDQFEAMRTAFFGGATAIFVELAKRAQRSKGESTPADHAHMQAIRDELKAFTREMMIDQEPAGNA